MERRQNSPNKLGDTDTRFYSHIPKTKVQPTQQIGTRHFPSITHLLSVLKTFRSSIGPNRVLHLLLLSHETEEGKSFTRQVVVMESGNDQPTRPGTRNPREPPALSQYQEL
ncbi:uncharacterized protein CLUP02_15202 [Colletotrichum lupini]|uniref:Uncharacterized protein n=1 Tax=Colletotrichum lupini TaxID=145971 RepID=A0A9Q8T5M5_9PEZI|nr:uncharacterized protein CLUP02_15202 [Colletotrichum lupini]UQC89671.1 hypothetical protein CLUP02_15202 [Colletotrichum lupini]